MLPRLASIIPEFLPIYLSSHFEAEKTVKTLPIFRNEKNNLKALPKSLGGEYKETMADWIAKRNQTLVEVDKYFEDFLDELSNGHNLN